jgi:hypothetical protein
LKPKSWQTKVAPYAVMEIEATADPAKQRILVREQLERCNAAGPDESSKADEIRIAGSNSANEWLGLQRQSKRRQGIAKNGHKRLPSRSGGFKTTPEAAFPA